MNFSHGKGILVVVSACFPQLKDDVVEATFFGHIKKFLDPNALRFSSLSKPKQIIQKK